MSIQSRVKESEGMVSYILPERFEIENKTHNTNFFECFKKVTSF